MVTNLLSDEKSFRVRVVKDIYLDLLNLDEAEQVAEIIASRESKITTFGKMTYIYTEVEQLIHNSIGE